MTDPGLTVGGRPAVVVDLARAGFTDAVEVGRGGFGVVFRCTQEALNRTVAVKLLDTDLDTVSRERFFREGRAMGGLSGHPNVVDVLQVGVTHSGRPYIVMPFQSLDSLAVRVRREGPLQWQEATRLGVRLSGALECAHRVATLHRDIKPANILLSDYGEAQLTDFGIARIEGGFETATGAFTGSLSYSAPEVLNGRPPTPQSDIYGLAAALFSIIAGRAAFERREGEEIIAQFLRITGQPIPDLRGHGVPDELCAVLERAMAKDPADRPASAEAFGHDLQDVQRAAGLPVTDMALPVGRRQSDDETVTSSVDGHAAAWLPPAPGGHSDRPAGAAGAAGGGLTNDPGADVPATLRVCASRDIGRPGPGRWPAAGQPPPDGGPDAGHPPGDGSDVARSRPGAWPRAQATAPPPPGSLPPRTRRPLVASLAAAVVVLVGLGAYLGVGRLAGPLAVPATPATRTPVPPPSPVPTVAATSVAVPSLGRPIPVGGTPAFAAASPNGRQVYVAGGNSDTIVVIDTAVNAVTARIPVPAGPPRFLAFAPDARTLYVSVWNDERTVHAVSVLDTTTNTIVATIPVRTRPFLAAVTPDGKRLYVPNHDSGTISVIDTSTRKVTKEISVAPNPHWVAFSPDGARAYTANHESNLVSVLDTATDTVLATVPVGKSPHSIAVHPTRPLVANVNYDDASVTMIDTTVRKVVATIPVGRNPQNIAWAPDGRFAYTTNVTDDSVSVIDVATRTVTATIPAGRSPTSIAVLPNGRTGYVTDLDGGTLTMLNLTG